jgi:hypothetical protein
LKSIALLAIGCISHMLNGHDWEKYHKKEKEAKKIKTSM